MEVPNFWNGYAIGTNPDRYFKEKLARARSRMNTLYGLILNLDKETENERRIIARLLKTLNDRRVSAEEADLIVHEIRARAETVSVLECRHGTLMKEYEAIKKIYINLEKEN